MDVAAARRQPRAGAGTKLVKNIMPGLGGSDLAELTNVGGTLFFAASDGNACLGGHLLYISDGTLAGTKRLGNLCDPAEFTGLGSLVLFRATDDDLYPLPGRGCGLVLTCGTKPQPGRR
jgi:ELWxxDGT repeat protein